MQQGIRVRVGAVIVRNGAIVLVEDFPHVPVLPQVGERLLATLHGAQEEDILYQGLL
jgi:hypothetical protein